LLDKSRAPLDRLHAYIFATMERAQAEQVYRGCLYGNFTAEAANNSEPIRERLHEIYETVRSGFADCLRDAVASGDIRPGLDCDEMAGFFVTSLQGAILLSKAYRDVGPIERAERMLFSMIEKKAA
jgi:TetR/AcrR family transcriptional repressor of nem operon